VRRRLLRAYGPIQVQQKGPIVDCLVGTVLSQHTSDINSSRAFRSLKERWPSWDAFAEASLDEIEEAIRPGGLARLKAPRIRAILDEILEREGRVDLTGLEPLADDEVYAYLRSLPGVGPKTADCVLAFSMQRDASPSIPMCTEWSAGSVGCRPRPRPSWRAGSSGPASPQVCAMSCTWP